MPSERDVRVGDVYRKVYRKGRSTRTVMGLIPMCPACCSLLEYDEYKGVGLFNKRATVLVSTFKRWVKGARLIHAAD